MNDRSMFDDAIARTDDPDRKATLELCREYFCNPDFRAAFEQHVFDLNNAFTKPGA